MSLKQLIPLTFFILFGFTSSVTAQDLVFSQYYNAPISLNPAFAGNTDYPHFNINYRNQWPTFDAYKSYAASYDQYFYNAKSAIGVMVTSDDLGGGIMKNNNINLTYGYKIEFKDNWQLKIGVSGVFGQTRLDWDQLIFYDQIDPVEGFQETTTSFEIRPTDLATTYFGINTGVLLYNESWYVGTSFYNLNSPYQGFWDSNQEQVGLPIRYSFHSGYTFMIAEENKNQFGTFLTANILATMQAGFVQITPGVAFQRERLIGGLWYRNVINNSDAAIVSLGFMFDNFRVTYSYDITISKLSIGSGGSHEIGIVFNLKNLVPERSRINNCLKLFK